MSSRSVRLASGDDWSRLLCEIGVVGVRAARANFLGLTALLAGLCLFGRSGQATDGVWTGPGTVWNTGANWSSSPTVPDGVATFTNNGAPRLIGLSDFATINEMLFTEKAPPYSFSIPSGSFATIPGLTIIGSGIVNDSEFSPVITVNTFEGLHIHGGTLAFGVRQVPAMQPSMRAAVPMSVRLKLPFGLPITARRATPSSPARMPSTF